VVFKIPTIPSPLKMVFSLTLFEASIKGVCCRTLRFASFCKFRPGMGLGRLKDCLKLHLQLLTHHIRGLDLKSGVTKVLKTTYTLSPSNFQVKIQF
jgi:hypothetical protein